MHDTALPLGTLVEYQPHHPGDEWHPCRWRIIEVCVRQAVWQPTAAVHYTLQCVDPLPGAYAMDCVVRHDQVRGVPQDLA